MGMCVPIICFYTVNVHYDSKSVNKLHYDEKYTLACLNMDTTYPEGYISLTSQKTCRFNWSLSWQSTSVVILYRLNTQTTCRFRSVAVINLNAIYHHCKRAFAKKILLKNDPENILFFFYKMKVKYLFYFHKKI